MPDFFTENETNSIFSSDSAPDPAGGALTASPKHPAGFLEKEREKRKGERGKAGGGKVGTEKGEGKG